ncbi:hypothetical protein [Photobacterium arenosum]|uniref:hypothetical protein n=1 Tax=Photobacterium arenosum TaxID=2774143 RepID=UPI00288C1937|nr:hypothetical protein [Photobacterium arenosum]
MKRKLLNLSIVAALGFAISACGGGSSSSNDTANNNSSGGDQNQSGDVSTGRLIDAAVQGMDYVTATQSGTTNANGEFSYKPGEKVTFKMGGHSFTSVDAGNVITPLDLAGTDDINNNAVVNIVRLLMTLDTDGDPSNGIAINETVKNTASQINFNVAPADFGNESNVTALLSQAGKSASDLPDEAEAKAHFEESLSTTTADLKGMFSLGWEVGEDSEYAGIVNIFPNGHFLVVEYEYEVEDQDEDLWQGFQYGSFKLKGTDLVGKKISWSKDNDNNGIADDHFDGGLASDDIITNFVVSDASLSLTWTDPTPSDDEDASGDEVFPRVATSNTIVGSWELKEEPAEEGNNSGHVIFNFRDDGKFFLVQLADSEVPEGEDGDIGIEYGTYSHMNNVDLTLDLIFDGSGPSLLHDNGVQSMTHSVTVSEDGKTLTLDITDSLNERYDVEFNRLL